MATPPHKCYMKTGALFVETRDGEQSQQDRPKTTSIKWTDSERELLFNYVERNRQEKKKNNWIECSKLIGTKTSRQCYDCYNLQNYEQNGKKHKWTQEEVQRLMTIQQSQLSWREFQRTKFPEFSVSQLKNKYKQVQSKRRQSTSALYEPRRTISQHFGQFSGPGSALQLPYNIMEPYVTQLPVAKPFSSMPLLPHVNTEENSFNALSTEYDVFGEMFDF